MGFFGDLGRTLSGGSQSSTEARAASGFALLPPELQEAFKSYSTGVTDLFGGEGSTDLFTPLPQTEFETSALGAIGEGLAPTEESLTSDIAMQMNPFNEFVIGDINRRAGGEYSILKQLASEMGQMGSNRQLLGASDIEERRLGTIGKLQQDQYNTALSNAHTQIPSLKSGDIASKFTAGEFLRGMDTATKQAPVAELQTFGGMLGAIPQTGGSTSTSSAVSESSNEGIGGTLAALAAAFSDRRLKENIEKVGEENGFNIYEFNYKHNPDKRFRGVMAQEVQEIMPEAVGESKGFLTVNYDLIGVEMTEV